MKLCAKYYLEGAFAILKDDEVFFGPLQHKIVNQIVKDGSINAAAKNLGISYQHAWSIIDKMNRLSPVPIVIRKKGGKDGGGCRISDYGLRIYESFAVYSFKMNEYVSTINKEWEPNLI